MSKRLLALFTAAAILLTLCAAMADAPAVADAPAMPDLSQVPEFLFTYYEDGIGLGACPVYTAPSTERALRNGRASVNADGEIYVAGKDASGWLLVRYTTNGGGTRVGYIPRHNAKHFEKANRLVFSYIVCEAADAITVTDNPMMTTGGFATIPQGGVYAILGKYTYHGDWWYVETKIDGLYVRGFIPRTTQLLPSTRAIDEIPDASTFPQRSPDGRPLQGTMTVIGDACLVRRDANTATEWVARGFSYDILPCYGSKIGSTNIPWYYVCVDGTFGWIAGSLVRAN